MARECKLFSRPCHKELSIKNIIVSCVSSMRHKTGKHKLATKEAKERDIAKLLSWGDSTYGSEGVLSEVF